MRYSLAHMGEAGLKDVVVNLHHLGDKIKTELGEGGGGVERFIQEGRPKERPSGGAMSPAPGKYVGEGGSGPYGVDLYYSDETGKILGTGGGIKKVREFFGGSTFVVFNGKIVCNVDIARAVAFHKSMGALATMVLRPEPDPYSWGAVEVDGAGWIQSIAGVMRPDAEEAKKAAKKRTRGGEGKGKGDGNGDGDGDGDGDGGGDGNGDGDGDGMERICWEPDVPVRGYVFTGIHIMEPEFLDILPEGPSCVVREGYFNHLKACAPLAGFVHEGYWQDHSTPTRYIEGNLRVLEWQTGIFENTGFPKLNGVHPDAEISESAAIVPPVRICAGARVGAGSRVGPGAVIGKGAVVRPGKVVSNSVVWDGVEVAGDAVSSVVTQEGVVSVDLTDPGAKTGPILKP